MSKTRERFSAYNELKEYFISGIKKTTGIIIKEEANIRNRLTELQGEDSEITEQIKGLKISLKLVKKEDVKKALEEIISIKEKELEKVDDESDNLKSQLAECTTEREEYENYINFLSDFDDEHDFINNNHINFEELSRDEFIAYLFIASNSGDSYFPGFSKKKMPEILHEVIDAIEVATENGWDSFIGWIEKN